MSEVSKYKLCTDLEPSHVEQCGTLCLQLGKGVLLDVLPEVTQTLLPEHKLERVIFAGEEEAGQYQAFIFLTLTPVCIQLQRCYLLLVPLPEGG